MVLYAKPQAVLELIAIFDIDSTPSVLVAAV
jgi:hypothetical protein